MKNDYLYELEDRFNQLLKRDETHEKDRERRALFYIIAGNMDLYKKVNYIYDFENQCIKTHCLGFDDYEIEENREKDPSNSHRCIRCESPVIHEDSSVCSYCEKLPDLCSSSKKLIQLAFNLFNGYPADVLSTFSGLDESNFNLCMNALKIRFNQF